MEFWSSGAPTPERHRAGISSIIWIFMPRERPVRMAAAETDSRVPTSRSSNQSSSTEDAQKGAKTDPKPFTTENASVVHQHHHAWPDMAHKA